MSRHCASLAGTCGGWTRQAQVPLSWVWWVDRCSTCNDKHVVAIKKNRYYGVNYRKTAWSGDGRKGDSGQDLKEEQELAGREGQENSRVQRPEG